MAQAQLVFTKAQKDLGHLVKTPKQVTREGHTYTEQYWTAPPGTDPRPHLQYRKWLDKVEESAKQRTGHSLHQLISMLRASGHHVDVHDVMVAGGAKGHAAVDPSTFVTHLSHMAGRKAAEEETVEGERHPRGETAGKMHAAEKKEAEAKGKGSALDELARLRTKKYAGRSRLERPIERPDKGVEKPSVAERIWKDAQEASRGAAEKPAAKAEEKPTAKAAEKPAVKPQAEPKAGPSPEPTPKPAVKSAHKPAPTPTHAKVDEDNDKTVVSLPPRMEPPTAEQRERMRASEAAHAKAAEGKAEPPKAGKHGGSHEAAAAKPAEKAAEKETPKTSTRGVPVTVAAQVKKPAQAPSTSAQVAHAKAETSSHHHVFTSAAPKTAAPKAKAKSEVAEENKEKAQEKKNEHHVPKERIGSTLSDLKRHPPGTVFHFPGGSKVRVTDEKKFAVSHPEHSPEERTLLYSQTHPQVKKWELGLTHRQKLAEELKRKKAAVEKAHRLAMQVIA